MTTGKAVALVTAAVAIPAAYFLLSYNRKPDESRWVARRFAQNTGLSEQEFYDLDKVNAKLRAHEPLTELEWARIEAASNSKAMEFRANSLVALGGAESTPYRDRAHAIMRRLARGPTPGDRLLALSVMVRVGDPETLRLLKQARADLSSDSLAGPKVEELLRKYNAEAH